MEVSTQVKRLIKDAGSLRALANKVKLSRQTIYALLNGGWPTAATANKLGIQLKGRKR